MAVLTYVRAGLLSAVLVLALASATSSVHAAEDTAPPPQAEEVETTIAVQSDADTDRKIQSRLQQLFSTVDGLSNVAVSVRGGVVDLTGVVPTAAVHQQAVQLARRVENVVEVRDRITESTDLSERLGRLANQLEAQLVRFVGYVPLLLVAIVLVVFSWWIARIVSGSERITGRFSRNPFLRDLAGQILRIGIIGVGVLLALEVLDASTLVGSLLGAAGVLGLAVGFALRDTVENYIASLLLSLRQPFSRNDLVVIEGHEGRVVRLTSRATILMTLDGNHVRIPNASVYKALIVNYTRNPKRRFQFDVGVDTSQNLAEAQDLAARTLSGMDGVLQDPPPMCTVEQLGDFNVILRVFGWVDQSAAEFNKVRSEAIRLVKGAFDRAGIIMPEPIYNVRVGPSAVVPSGAGTREQAAPAAVSEARTMSEAPQPRATAEPPKAIDIGRRNELDRQIEADLQATDEDLLRPQAPKE